MMRGGPYANAAKSPIRAERPWSTPQVRREVLDVTNRADAAGGRRRRARAADRPVPAGMALRPPLRRDVCADVRRIHGRRPRLFRDRGCIWIFRAVQRTPGAVGCR